MTKRTVTYKVEITIDGADLGVREKDDIMRAFGTPLALKRTITRGALDEYIGMDSLRDRDPTKFLKVRVTKQ